MSEIKLTLEDPELFAKQLTHAAKHWDDGRATPIGMALHMAAHQIEEQLPKPPIEEPTEFGSVIRARMGEREPLELWQRHGGGIAWISESGAYVGGFSMLRDAVVLRVGLGQMLTGEDLRIASEQVDEWVRLDDAHAEGDAVEALVNKLGEDLFNNGITSLGDLKQRLRDLAIDARAVAS